MDLTQLGPLEGSAFPALEAALKMAMYPTPSTGFNGRLLALLGLTGYLFAATLAFLILYVFALRRENKPFWVWRVVTKAEGKYIVANIFSFTFAFFITTPLIGAYIANTRDVYVEVKSQYHTFVWRNCIWILIWLQGWVYSYANVQAALITRTGKTSRRVPWLVNVTYIVVPILFTIGILVPGIRASQSWDKLYGDYLKALELLQAGAETYSTTGTIDIDTLAGLGQLEVVSLDNFATFENQYLVTLVLWTIASLILVGINIVGLVLVARLRRQIAASAASSTQDDTPSMMTIAHVPLGVVYPANSSPDAMEKRSSSDDGKVTPSELEHGQDKSSGKSFSSLAGLPQLELDEDQSERASQVAVHREGLGDLPTRPRQTLNTRAMRKLVRDLLIDITGVLSLALVFAADTTLIAAKRFTIYQAWATSEVACTLTVWSYLIIAGIVMTCIGLNEAVFLFSPAARVPEDLATDSARRVTEAVRVTLERAVVVDTPAATRPPARRSFVHRVPVPPVYLDNISIGHGSMTSMQSALEEVGAAH